MSSNPAHVTSKTPLVREATGNHRMNSTSLGKTQGPVSGLCYARNRVSNVVNFKKSTSLEKLRALSLVSATLEIEYAMQLLIVGFIPMLRENRLDCHQ